MRVGEPKMELPVITKSRRVHAVNGDILRSYDHDRNEAIIAIRPIGWRVVRWRRRWSPAVTTTTGWRRRRRGPPGLIRRFAWRGLSPPVIVHIHGHRGGSSRGRRGSGDGGDRGPETGIRGPVGSPPRDQTLCSLL